MLVLGVFPGTVCTIEVCVVFLDTLTPVFELELGSESLRVPGMGLQLCGLQVWCWLVSIVLWLVLVERLVEVLPIVVCPSGGMILVVDSWWYLMVVVSRQFGPISPVGSLVVNATGVCVTFLTRQPWWSRSACRPRGGLRLHARHVSRAGRHADIGLAKATPYTVTFRSQRREGGAPAGNLGRFGMLGSFSVWSRHEDVAWSGGDAGVIGLHVLREAECGGPAPIPEYLSSRVPEVLCEPGTLVLEVCPGTVCTVEVCVVFLDTLTPMFELYVQLRERRQRAATCLVLVDLHCSLACACGATVGPFIRDCETKR
ncbi:hypothetical protein Taro_013439 [Colocasia esculenta]|uniref:Uncharacterized protein n=1 Tax=Colocasia esculenta TaxID=4460 RepID=A0A843UFK3_COLES|nr:hypothetical protein [Colocasia esculenta]